MNKSNTEFCNAKFFYFLYYILKYGYYFTMVLYHNQTDFSNFKKTGFSQLAYNHKSYIL